MEWEAPAIVLDAQAYGEGGALVTVVTEVHGVFRSLARGGGGRGQGALWQRGNLVEARWVARLSDQLGSLTAELVHSVGASAMDDPLTLSILSASCAVAEGALPEREPYPSSFIGLLQLVAALAQGQQVLPDLVRFELTLLAELGYGLDLSHCAVTGATAGLAYVSPRTGRAVARDAAGPWAERLLKLPSFLTGANHFAPVDVWNGLLLTGHFLARDAFGQRHRPLPHARMALLDRVAAMATPSA